MAIFSSLLQVIFPLLHESNTKYSHFSVFFRTGDSLWFVLLGFAVITGSTNFHTDISLRTINHLLLLPLLLVRCARILRTRANVNIYTSFSGFAHSFSFNPGAGSKSNVGKARRGEELCYRLLNTPLFLLFAFDLLGYYC